MIPDSENGDSGLLKQIIDKTSEGRMSSPSDKLDYSKSDDSLSPLAEMQLESFKGL